MFKSIEEDLMTIINQDCPELDALYHQLVVADYSKPSLVKEIDFVIAPVEDHRVGP